MHSQEEPQEKHNLQEEKNKQTNKIGRIKFKF